ncbi:hypothetical protein [uncultured Marixanthomonas sp.]|uniref:hypothetical protein n=1 Tax=uncultured Marixanthomonas sp. TaxID=757245 RepID=UPI0030D80F7A|tara:strand:+ start:35207 stop:35368 length:162 start_codon:yes stop_codon:yes gene_type:complete
MNKNTQDNQTNQDHEDYILKDNAKTKFGASFIVIVLILLLVGVAISGMFFEWW